MSTPERAGEPGKPIRLLIADDHPVVRDGLSAMFARDPGFEVLGEARDGAEAVTLAQALKPDVILMDLRMPGMDGLTAITELARRGVPSRVLVLTTYDTDSYVLPAIEAGATGYMLKDAPRAELLHAVRAAAQGQAVLSPAVTTRLMSRVRAPGTGPLSQRELEVLELVAAGNTNREAAARLFITEATVKTHLLNIYAKLGVGVARLSDALGEVAGRWSALHGIPVQVTTTGTARPMPPEAEFALLRTAQEALANVARHARATRVGVTLSYMECQVALDVRDDGQGFDLKRLCAQAAGNNNTNGNTNTNGNSNGHTSTNGHGKASGHVSGLVGLSVGDGLRRHPAGSSDGGFGLVAMRQRIENLAGTLQVESEPGFGTGISACLPVASAEARS